MQKRKLIRKVDLRFFCDDTNGEWGVTHKQTLEGLNGYDGFNAFWDGQGLWHDVFEHSHEYEDEHFRGDAAMNVGGEMAAMGALWYYFDVMNVHNRLNPNGYYSPSQVTMSVTCDMVKEAIKENYCQFGDTLVSAVPKQKETDNPKLEYIIEEYAQQIAATVPKVDEPRNLVLGEEPNSFGKEYKASVSLEKIADLHRYGFNMAQKLVPYLYHNHVVLSEFIPFWNKFCKSHQAEDLQAEYKGITFSIYRTKDKEISWVAKFIPHYVSSYDYQPEKLVIRSEEIAA